jgi:hypothetical protein
VLLSICIVNWNTRDLLRDCLASIRAYPPKGADLEIIVVDNDSADGSADMVAEEFPEVDLVRHPTNSGYAEGNNIAFERVTGDLVLLLNPDVVMHAESLTRSVAFMREHPAAGAMACRLLSPDGSTQRSLRGFPDPFPVFCEYLGLARLFPGNKAIAGYRMDYFDYDRPGEADQPMASFFLIARRCLDDVGAMDPDFPIFFNDVDWCFRAKRERGWQILYTPRIAVTHHHGGSTRQVRPRMIVESHRSLIRFYEKHYVRRIPRALFLILRQAILWNERRNLRRLAKNEQA